MTIKEKVKEAIRKEIGSRHNGLPKGGWDGLMEKAALAAIEAMREPDDIMIGNVEEWRMRADGPSYVWQSMIDAALARS